MFFYKQDNTIFKSKYYISNPDYVLITEEEYNKEMTKLREVIRKEKESEPIENE